MLKKLVIGSVVLLTVCVESVFAGESFDDQTACAAIAFKEYLTSNQKFKHDKSLSDQIEQRRLQEQFCLRFAQCVVRDSNTKDDTEIANRFADCLQEEAVELYKLYKD
jgi:hypothetical protein